MKLKKKVMAINYFGKIKVKSSVKPLPIKERRKANLSIGSLYFVCFGNNNVYPCSLKSIITEFEQSEVVVCCRSSRFEATHTLYHDEIGDSPEHAVENTVH